MHAASSMALKARGATPANFYGTAKISLVALTRDYLIGFTITDTNGSPNTAICDIIWAPVKNYGQTKVRIAAQV